MNSKRTQPRTVRHRSQRELRFVGIGEEACLPAQFCISCTWSYLSRWAASTEKTVQDIQEHQARIQQPRRHCTKPILKCIARLCFALRAVHNCRHLNRPIHPRSPVTVAALCKLRGLSPPIAIRAIGIRPPSHLPWARFRGAPIARHGYFLAPPARAAAALPVAPELAPLPLCGPDLAIVAVAAPSRGHLPLLLVRAAPAGAAGVPAGALAAGGGLTATGALSPHVSARVLMLGRRHDEGMLGRWGP